MRRTLTVAAATAALLLPAGPLPVAEAGSALPPGKWSAREAENFWTADRMAAAAPMTPASAAPATDPGTGQDFDGIPVVGRMFVMKDGGAYFCTASVVASPAATWC